MRVVSSFDTICIRIVCQHVNSSVSSCNTVEPGDRTEEERQIYAQYENRRQRKNDRSRERAMEKKEGTSNKSLEEVSMKIYIYVGI